MNLPHLHFHRTRIAPTPSGYLHMGNVLAFAITAALAHKAGADVLLRIDDMDRERVRPEYVQDIFDTLQFMDIPYTEGPRDVQQFELDYSQQVRLPLYHKALEQLREKGVVYGCDCTRTQLAGWNMEHGCPGSCREKALALDAPDVNWRLKTNLVPMLHVNTHEGIVTTTLPAEMTDFVVRKKDGCPAYQLTSLIDDVFYNIDGIVRGEDLWHSTLAQQNLAAQLAFTSFQEVLFYHHPLLMNETDKKLSKSAGATSIQYLRKLGNTSADIYTIIGSLLKPVVNADSWRRW
ncbi:glutamyl-tRNA synthetase [Filimonas lacunae]|uniref:Glutamyl-tRNA synthetase n=1 Tax=Filimonas lacunae TaxID=477680 RepID=A0A173MJU9_9BACT|nr:glutamate--tRNA ligase family protein [Filimonas lacunae]BAV07913.1 glutamyl-Q-tRNA synthetase [Filimonas lacunae]SIT06443.1 glutamyl-tRNA synthetase [Filimonas lacunae]